MQAASPLSAVVPFAAALMLAACGGSQSLSPTAPGNSDVATVSTSADGGATAADGYGPGTGTCTNDCDGTRQGPGPGSGGVYGPGPGPSDGFCGSACTGPVGPDPDDLVPILERALQEEYGAEMLYRSVLASFGPDTAPFAQIADAEVRHALALQQLFARRDLVVPAWSPVPFPAFGTLAEACAAGVAAEIADAALYQPYLERDDLPLDVRTVFTNLQAASLENHLPAFERCQ